MNTVKEITKRLPVTTYQFVSILVDAVYPTHCHKDCPFRSKHMEFKCNRFRRRLAIIHSEGVECERCDKCKEVFGDMKLKRR